MENNIHKYELYTADFYASETSTTYIHIAYADTFEEAIETLVKKQDCHRSDPEEYNKIVKMRFVHIPNLNLMVAMKFAFMVGVAITANICVKFLVMWMHP